MACSTLERLIPSAPFATIMDLESVAPVILMSNPSSLNCGALPAICATVTLPINPVPTKPTCMGTCLV